MYTREDVVYKLGIPEDLVTDELVEDINSGPFTGIYPIVKNACVIGYYVLHTNEGEKK